MHQAQEHFITTIHIAGVIGTEFHALLKPSVWKEHQKGVLVLSFPDFTDNFSTMYKL